jgi:saccharopine dehydrogenase-like NADP-dependent oxidoreductase
MKIALLGAGHIGQTIARLLHCSGDYRVRVLDRNGAALERLRAEGIRGEQIDTEDRDALGRALRADGGTDTVVNALPYHLAIPAAHLARDNGCHYFDLTEDVAATKEIQRIASGATTAFMPQCGLAPGFIGIVAHHLARRFDSLHDVKMRVGALPAFPTNALKYNLTWSVDGLINEYCHPCEAIHDGVAIAALPLEGLEHFSLDGTEYEAFNTSGGLGTLCETWAGKVRNLDYKTVRYPGHRALMMFLLDDLQLKADQPLLKSILRKSMPATMQDVVLVFVTVSGMKNGSLVQEVFARKIFAERDEANPLSAIQITTAAGICAAVDLFREGRLPQRGFVRQEAVALPDFLANRFGSCLPAVAPRREHRLIDGRPPMRLRRPPHWGRAGRFGAAVRGGPRAGPGGSGGCRHLPALWNTEFQTSSLPGDAMSIPQQTHDLLATLGVARDAFQGGTRTVRSPIDGSVIGTPPEADAAQMQAAIARAHGAFLQWRNVPAPRRGELVRLFGSELRTHKATLARLVSLEAGKVTSEGEGEVQEMIDICDFATGLSRQLYGLTIASERPGHRMTETWHPIGPVGIISAFNFPVAVWSWNAALALVCGDPVIWKPSEKAPLSAIAAHRALERAIARFGDDAPEGLSQLVIGGAAIGEALVASPAIPVISATGSTRMGQIVGPKVMARWGRPILELGGNNAMIVAPTADLDMAVRAIVFGAVGTAGQRCTSLRRLIAHRRCAMPDLAAGARLCIAARRRPAR